MKKQFITKSNVQGIFKQVKSLLNDCNVKITEWDIRQYTIDDLYKQYVLSITAKGKYLAAYFDDTENGLKNIEYNTLVGTIDYISKTTDIDNVVNAIAREFAPIAENLNGKTVGYWFYTTPMLPEEHFQVHVEITDENNNYISTITVNRVNGEIQVNDRISYENRVFDRKINEREEKFAIEVAKKAFAANEKWINNELATQKFHGMDNGFEVVEMSESDLNKVEENIVEDQEIGTIEIVGKHPRGYDITRKLIKIDRNKTKHWMYNMVSCQKCGGYGGADAWTYTGWTCYRCGGSGIDPNGLIEKEYTPEYRAKLDERNAIKREKHHQEIVAQMKKELDETYPDHKIYIVLGDTFEIKDRIKADGGHFNNVHKWTFNKPVDGYDLFAVDLEDAFEFSDDGLPMYDKPKQIDLPKPKTENESNWIGSPKERIKLKVKVKKLFEYEVPNRFDPWVIENITMCNFIFEDENGNVLMCKTNPHLKYKSIGKYMQPKIGDELEINATIKEHSEYRGIKQTIIQRVVVE